MIFLRPWALLLLVLPFVIKGVKRFTRPKTPWTKLIDPTLLAALLVQGKSNKIKHLWTGYMVFLWSLWTFALAGPAFYKLPTPATQSAPNTILVFDLSMQGKDLLQGQAKLYDLLTSLRGERVGLVVFGQNQGYTAMPLTPDISLIKEIVPTLTANVLPEPALSPEAGFDYAAQLLDKAGGKGRILYVTNQEKTWNGQYPFGVLDLNKRTADEKDIQDLLEQTKNDVQTGDTTFSTTADVWADLGGWLVLLSLPIFAVLFRKGLLFAGLLILAVQAEAGFFWRHDQEVYHTEKKAIEAYEKQDYTKATHLFQQTGNLYNLGNALAHAGDIQGAINAYTEALKKNPENQDAKFNKEYLEKQLPPPEEQQKQNEDGKSDDKKDQSDENSNQDQQASPQQDNDQQNEQDQTESENQPAPQFDSTDPETEQQQNQQPTQEETKEQLEQALADYEKESYNQEEQQIINRLNHDPSRVLRYRLLLQYQQGKTK